MPMRTVSKIISPTRARVAARERRSALRPLDELVQHAAPRGSEIAAVVTASAETHYTTATHFVRERAEAARGMRVRRRRVLKVSERIARDTVRSALEDDEFRLVLAQVRN